MLKYNLDFHIKYGYSLVKKEIKQELLIYKSRPWHRFKLTFTVHHLQSILPPKPQVDTMKFTYITHLNYIPIFYSSIIPKTYRRTGATLGFIKNFIQINRKNLTELGVVELHLL